MKKWFNVLALAMVLVFVLSACSGNSSPSPSATPTPSQSSTAGTTSTPSATPEATPAANLEKVLRLAEGETCATYNPHKAMSAQQYTQLKWVNGMLYDRVWGEEEQNHIFKDELADGMPVCVSGEDNKTWQIKVRQGYTYEDGTPITAHSFIYSWKMLFDPKLANRNFNVMYSIEGSEAYYTGENTNWDDVKIYAKDDYTIEFTYADEYVPELKDDVAEMFAFVGCGLVHEEMFESCFNADRTENDYGTTPEKFVASGAYRVVKLIEDQYMEYEKWIGGSPFAEGFWQPDRIIVYSVAEPSTRVQMYENGEVDFVGASYPQYAEHPDANYSYTPDSYGLFLNARCKTNPVLTDVNFRYAIFWGLDRETIVKSCYPTHKPDPHHYQFATTFPDPTDPENKKLIYRDTPEAKAIRLDGHEVDGMCFDPDLAKEYFEKAYTKNGSTKITVELKYVESNDISKAWAETLQQHFQTLFGEDKFAINLRAVPSAVIYENLSRENLDYEIMAAGGIYPNIEYPYSNSNWVSSGTDTYSTQYTVISPEGAAEWDDLYYKSTKYEYKQARDWQKRLEASARMEEILYTEATFIPAYTRGVRYLIAPHIEPLMPVGDPFVEFALLQANYYPAE